MKDFKIVLPKDFCYGCSLLALLLSFVSLSGVGPTPVDPATYFAVVSVAFGVLSLVSKTPSE